MKTLVWPAFIFVIAWVLGAYFGIPLRSIVMPIYHLMPGANWLISLLVVLVVFLLCLIEGARRLHLRTLNEIFQANEGITKEYFESVAKIEMWTLFKGRFDSLYCLLDNRRWDGGAPLSKQEIEYQEADLHNKLQDSLGPDYVTEYFGRLGDITGSVLSQSDRMRTHSNQQLHRLIQTERQHQLSIAAKSSEQKQEVLKKLRAESQDSVPNLGSISSSKID